MSAEPNPRTLLLPDPDAIPSVLGDKAATIFASFIGMAGVAFERYLNRRPLYSGIQSYILWGTGGAVLGYLATLRYQRYNSDRDAAYRHYIDLHPEDFPIPERKRVGEVFKTFIPIR
ncbi:unnamed protein product [Nesidiocoris tenuis]|nr:NADH dehydrogenase [ubiquinone] 1 alpha subcomplex subunit 9, mitochondrial [Nesidiocoris tenuis]CAB0007834.1 unnamed protein product [Nesidiocoris tenuis]CAB0007850.1 unnamed protein product [Nesidiocoris tenuis]